MSSNQLQGDMMVEIVYSFYLDYTNILHLNFHHECANIWFWSGIFKAKKSTKEKFHEQSGSFLTTFNYYDSTSIMEITG